MPYSHKDQHVTFSQHPILDTCDMDPELLQRLLYRLQLDSIFSIEYVSARLSVPGFVSPSIPLDSLS